MKNILIFTKKINSNLLKNINYIIIASLLAIVVNNKKYFHQLYHSFNFILNKRNGDLHAYLVASKYIKNGEGNAYKDFLGYDIAKYNYPSFFAILAYLPGFSLENIFIIAHIISTIVIFLILYIWRPYNWHTYLIFFLCIFSPSVILAFERGNTDLIIFILIGIGIILNRNIIISNFILLVAGFFKLFPIAALSNILILKKTRFFFILFCFYSIIFCLYVIIIKNEIKMILQNTPYSIYDLSYGIKIIPEIIFQKTGINKIKIYTLYTIFLIIASSLCIAFFIKKIKGLIIDDNTSFYSYLVGMLIFSFTFILGINWDYRKIFLLFTIPFLLKNIKTKIFLLMVLLTILILWEQLFSRVILPIKISFFYNIIGNLFIIMHISFFIAIVYKYLIMKKKYVLLSFYNNN